MNTSEKKDKRYKMEREEKEQAKLKGDSKTKVSFTKTLKKQEMERDKIIQKMRNISRLLACIKRRNIKYKDTSKEYSDMVQAMDIVQRRLSAIDAGDALAIDVVGDATLQDDLDEVATTAKGYINHRYAKMSPAARNKQSEVPLILICMLSADLGASLGETYFEMKKIIDDIEQQGVDKVVDKVTEAVLGMFGDDEAKEKDSAQTGIVEKIMNEVEAKTNIDFGELTGKDKEHKKHEKAEKKVKAPEKKPKEKKEKELKVPELQLNKNH